MAEFYPLSLQVNSQNGIALQSHCQLSQLSQLVFTV